MNKLTQKGILRRWKTTREHHIARNNATWDGVSHIMIWYVLSFFGISLTAFVSWSFLFHISYTNSQIDKKYCRASWLFVYEWVICSKVWKFFEVDFWKMYAVCLMSVKNKMVWKNRRQVGLKEFQELFLLLRLFSNNPFLQLTLKIFGNQLNYLTKISKDSNVECFLVCWLYRCFLRKECDIWYFVQNCNMPPSECAYNFTV